MNLKWHFISHWEIPTRRKSNQQEVALLTTIHIKSIGNLARKIISTGTHFYPRERKLKKWVEEKRSFSNYRLAIKELLNNKSKNSHHCDSSVLDFFSLHVELGLLFLW